MKTASGVAAALIFGYIVSILSNPKVKWKNIIL
jgi:hypothetical protein